LASARAAPQEVVTVSEAPVAVAVSEPVAPVVEAVVPVAEPVVPVATAPVVPVATTVERAINTCRVEFEPLETQTCTPRPERACQPLDVVAQVRIRPKMTSQPNLIRFVIKFKEPIVNVKD